MERRIIHLDMDAFYASVEQRDRPELRGRPVAVGGSSRRAVVAAASYEARTFGVRSAMPMFRARRLCPDLVVVDLRMEHYRAVSQQIRAILDAHTDLIEPLALDEFYLDVSAGAASIGDAGALARQMKDEIQRGTGLTASAGVAPSKFVAKIASDLRKPDGLVIVEPDAVVAFLAPLPVSRMWGVGQVTEPVKTQFGYHLIKLDSLQGFTFEDAKPELERKLKPQMAQKALEDLEKKSNAVLDRLAEPHLKRPVGRPPREGYEDVIELGPYRAEPWRHSQRLILVIIDRPDSVAPASKTLAMFGWSMSASACRSASKRAMISRVSMPSLMILRATRRRTGSSCSAM
jgi:hypothetical protein